MLILAACTHPDEVLPLGHPSGFDLSSSGANMEPTLAIPASMDDSVFSSGSSALVVIESRSFFRRIEKRIADS